MNKMDQRPGTGALSYPPKDPPKDSSRNNQDPKSQAELKVQHSGDMQHIMTTKPWDS
jgi:hypothetical protein